MKLPLAFALIMSTVISLRAQQAPVKAEKKDTIYIGGAESFLTESKDWHNAVGYLIKKEFRPYKYVRKIIYLDEPKLMASYQCYDQKYVMPDTTMNYIETIKDGAYEERYRNGQSKILCKYAKNELDGDFKVFYPSGQLKRHEVWQLGKWVEGKCFDETGAEIPYTDFVTMPTFPKSFFEFIAKNIQYPQFDRENGLEGGVLIGFIVDIDGTIHDCYIKNSSGSSSLDEEVLRVVKLSPKIEPARVNGVPIKTNSEKLIKYKLR